MPSNPSTSLEIVHQILNNTDHAMLLGSAKSEAEKNVLICALERLLEKLPVAATDKRPYTSFQMRLRIAMQEIAKDAWETSVNQEASRLLRLFLRHGFVPAIPTVATCPFLNMDLAAYYKRPVDIDFTMLVIASPFDAESFIQYCRNFQCQHFAETILRQSIWFAAYVKAYFLHQFEEQYLAQILARITHCECKTALWTSFLGKSHDFLLTCPDYLYTWILEQPFCVKHSKELCLHFDVLLFIISLSEIRSIPISNLLDALLERQLEFIHTSSEGVSDLVASKYMACVSGLVSKFPQRKEKLDHLFRLAFQTGIHFPKVKIAACRGLSAYVRSNPDAAHLYINDLHALLSDGTASWKLRWNISVCLGAVQLDLLDANLLLKCWYEELRRLSNFKFALHLSHLCLTMSFEKGIDLERSIIWEASKSCRHFIEKNSKSLERYDNDEFVLQTAEKLLKLLDEYDWPREIIL